MTDGSLTLVLGSDEPDAIEVMLDIQDPEGEFPALSRAGAVVHGSLRLPWSWVLAFADLEDADPQLRSALLHRLPPGVAPDEEAFLLDLLREADLPPRTKLRLEPRVRGVAGQTGFRIEPIWLEAQPATGRGEVRWRPLPGRRTPVHEGGRLREDSGATSRLSSTQHALLQLLDRDYVGTGDRDADMRFKAELASFVPAEDPTVSLERQFRDMPLRSVDTVQPRLDREGEGYRARPTTEVLPSDLLSDYFDRTPPERLGADRPHVRNAVTGRSEVVVFQTPAQAGMRALRERAPISPEDVPEVLTDPAGYFGPEVDTSALSERVTGLGPPIRRVLPVVKEIPSESWWDWDVEAEVSALDDEDEEPSPPISFKDPKVRAKLKASLARADEKGHTFIPHPTEEGTYVPVDASLRAGLAAADALDDEEKRSGGRLQRRPGDVLHVLENLEQLGFDKDAERKGPAVAPIPPPRSLRAEYRLQPHQVEGYAWLAHLFGDAKGDGERWQGALLADDMGLGKTLQVLSFLAWGLENGFAGPHLVVAPVALLENWQQEARRFFGDALDPILQVRSSELPREPEVAAAEMSRHQLVLVSYETLRSRELAFARVPFGLVVLDEAQKAKEPSSQIARVVRTLRARARLAMTGTPVENSLKELWTLMDWALPGYLGSLREFAAVYIKPLRGRLESEEAVELSRQLQERIEPVFLRRMKSEVLADLPTIHRESLHASLSETQTERYRRVVGQKTNAALGRLITLLGLCAHPDLTGANTRLPPVEDHSFPKAEHLIGLLRAIEQRGEKVLLFANRRSIQQWLAELIRGVFSIRVDIINGQVNDSRARMRIIERFSAEPGFGALVLAPRAAGVGLNITAANHVIHYMREWNPAIENQATDRAYRIGQNKPVTVYTLTATSSAGITVEERLDQLLEKKRALMKQFIIPMGAYAVSPEELVGEDGSASASL